MSSQLRADPANHAVILAQLAKKLGCLAIPPECDDPVAFLVVLADKMRVERNDRDDGMQLPEMTMGRQGGDVDDVILLLATMARQAGIPYRVRYEAPRLLLEVRQNDGWPWMQIGPIYNPLADMTSSFFDAASEEESPK